MGAEYCRNGPALRSAVGPAGGLGWAGGLFAFWLLTPLIATAQDTHYWTDQYGPRGELAGGLVVGTFADLSSTFYNPGATAVVTEAALNLTTAAYQLVDVGLTGVEELGSDLRSTRLRRTPSIIAVQLPVGANRHRFAVSVLTRHDFRFTAAGRQFNTYEDVQSDPEAGSFSTETTADYSLSEGWGGVTWAYPLGPRVGVGITTYAAVRSQSARTSGSLQHVESTGAGLASLVVEDYSYWHARLVWKAGVAIDLRPLTVGLAATTPSVGLFGSGRVTYHDGKVPPDEPSRLLASTQEGLSSTYRSPPSVAFGATYSWTKTQLFVSTEWFASESRYKILDAEAFTGQTTGEPVSIDLDYGLVSVFNWGVGFEQFIGDKVDLYASFITDHSALDDANPDQRVALTGWDIKHITVGAAFDVLEFGITSGFSFGWGEERQDDNFPIPGDPVLRYRSYKLILGFEFEF